MKIDEGEKGKKKLKTRKENYKEKKTKKYTNLNIFFVSEKITNTNLVKKNKKQ